MGLQPPLLCASWTRSATPLKTSSPLNRRSLSHWPIPIQTSSSPLSLPLSSYARTTPPPSSSSGEPRAPTVAPFCSSTHMTALSGLICHCGVHRARIARSLHTVRRAEHWPKAFTATSSSPCHLTVAFDSRRGNTVILLMHFFSPSLLDLASFNSTTQPIANRRLVLI